MNAAKAWLESASIDQRLKLAASDFEYGDLLCDLAEKGLLVPRSTDRDFSWGFFKQVKSFTFNVMYRHIKERRARRGMATRTKVFISYSHQDSAWLARLQVHLKPLIRSEQIDLWDDTLIRPGMQWRNEIGRAIANARVAILLVSPNFLASDFIQTDELPHLLQKASSDGTQVLSLVLRPCLFSENTSLSQYQAVNDPARPLSGMSEHDVDAVLSGLARHLMNLIGTP